MKVKICGITNEYDAAKACEYGADYLGFIFVQNTPRIVEPEKAKEITESLPRGVGKVGLFMDNVIDKVADVVILCDLDHVQLHGGESPDYCRQLKEALGRRGRDISIIKALRVSEKILGTSASEYIHADYFVFDTFQPGTPGGTGSKFNWDVLKEQRDEIEKPFFLAGGLNPENVAEAIRIVDPYGVDVASGVEKFPGRKNEYLLKEFIENAKNLQIT